MEKTTKGGVATQVGSSLLEYMKDVDGMLSSKRLLTMLSFAIMVVTWVADLIFNLTVEEYVFEGFLWLTAVGLGTVVVEKFSRKKADTVNEGPTVDVDMDLDEIGLGE